MGKEKLFLICSVARKSSTLAGRIRFFLSYFLSKKRGWLQRWMLRASLNRRNLAVFLFSGLKTAAQQAPRAAPPLLRLLPRSSSIAHPFPVCRLAGCAPPSPFQQWWLCSSVVLQQEWVAIALAVLQCGGKSQKHKKRWGCDTC